MGFFYKGFFSYETLNSMSIPEIFKWIDLRNERVSDENKQIEKQKKESKNGW